MPGSSTHEVLPSTPTRATREQSPIHGSTASPSTSLQTHDATRKRLQNELSDKVFDNVENFITHFFESSSWYNQSSNAKAKLEAASLLADNEWKDFPHPPTEHAMLTWLFAIQDCLFVQNSHKFYEATSKPLKGSDALRKPDLFLAATGLDDIREWKDVLVVGSLKENPKDDMDKNTLLQLANYIREVFFAQADRRFVHAFTICGSLVRLYMFDRSGAYSSRAFSVEQDPERFARLLMGYSCMSATELGLSTMIQVDGNERYIDLQPDKVTGGYQHGNKPVRITLGDDSILRRKAIVSRGTCCLPGKMHGSADWNCVVKFSWQPKKTYMEGELLQLAMRSGVQYVVSPIYSEVLHANGTEESTESLRANLKFDTARKRLMVKHKSTQSDSILYSNPSQSVATQSSPRKRLASSEFDLAVKRVKPGTSTSDKDLPTTSYPVAPSAQIPAASFENRLHCCIVLEPYGRPINDFRSVTEFLEAIRDSIRGHRSLLQKGEILHRDVSENNIIITSPASEGDPVGLLIDLDSSLRLNSGPTGARHRTGTIEFMAIGVLEGLQDEPQSYRHDLESFFYVMLWTCIQHRSRFEAVAKNLGIAPPVKQTKALLKWGTGNFTDVAEIKFSDMSWRKSSSNVGFGKILNLLPPGLTYLATLAADFRALLFGPPDMALECGPFDDAEQDMIYDKVEEIFNTAIKEAGASSLAVAEE